MTWKVVNISDAGTASKFGADDMDKVSKAFGGIDVDDFDINLDCKIRSAKLQLRNPANTFAYIITSAAIAADRILNLPLITATDTLATLGLSQTFTQPQTIFYTNSTMFTLYRDSNVVADGAQINFDAEDSLGAQTNYAQIRGEIRANTDGAETGVMYLKTTTAGALATRVKIWDDGSIDMGANTRLRLVDTGLSSTRTFTFPNSTSLLFGNGVDNAFGAHYLDIDNIAAPSNPASGTRRIFFDIGTGELSVRTSAGTTVSLESGAGGGGDMVLANVQTVTGAKTFNDTKTLFRNPANTFSYTLKSGAIAADRQLNLPLTTATDTLATLGLAQTFTQDQTIGAKLDVNKHFHRTGVISPTQITSDQNNYTPTNLMTSSVVRLDADSSFRTITGLGDTTQMDGCIMMLRNISANTILLAHENANSTAANRFDNGGVDYPLFGGSQVELTYDGTLARWKHTGGAQTIIPTPRRGIYAQSHYIADTSVESGVFTEVSASGGTAAAITAVVPHYGVLELTWGTSGTGNATSKINNSSIIFGNNWYWRYEAIVKIVTLSSADPDYTLRIGFIDSNSAESTDGIFFRYNDNVNSAKWQKVTRNNNTETGSANDTTVTADTNWHRYTIVVNPAGNVAEFFIDGVSKGTETTNIPTGAGRATGAGVMFLKTAGTTDAAGIDIDSQEIIAYANTTL
jgi:hypothetical protein